MCLLNVAITFITNVHSRQAGRPVALPGHLRRGVCPVRHHPDLREEEEQARHGGV